MITVERIGRRSYLRGAPYAMRERLRAAGAKWDAAERAWWLSKDQEAHALAEALHIANDAPRAEGLTDDTRLLGRATYKGKSYLVLWEGTTARGPAAKLCIAKADATPFWVSQGEYEIVKRYAPREIRGRMEPYTWGKHRAFLERAAEARAQGYEDGRPHGTRYTCEECGEFAVRGEGSCWETGAPH